MISFSLPRSRKTCGWSNGGVAPTHMNSCEPISITETPASLWKCVTTWSDILFSPWMAMTDGHNQRDAAFEMPRTILTGSVDSKSPDSGRYQSLICSCKFDTILSSQRSPSFVGAVVSQMRHTMLRQAKTQGFSG